MFPRYYIQHPLDLRDVHLGPGAYVLAALTGPLYALWMVGGRGAIRLAPLTMLSLAGLIAVFAVTSYVPHLQQAILLCIAIAWILIRQSRRTIDVVRSVYMRKGWTVHEI